MTLFRSFTIPLWLMFAGELLLLICSFFYLAWWIILFRPNSAGGGPISSFCMTAAVITGITAIALISFSAVSLSGDSKGVPVSCILAGGVVLLLILLPVTSVIFRRQVTSELFIIFIWTILELCAIAVLYGTNRFETGFTIVFTILVAAAFITGMICYMLYYNLDEKAGYYTGMIPLIADVAVMAVFLVGLSVS
jgi:hypothetical protein